jgi:hypothetical protein
MVRRRRRGLLLPGWESSRWGRVVPRSGSAVLLLPWRASSWWWWRWDSIVAAVVVVASRSTSLVVPRSRARLPTILKPRSRAAGGSTLPWPHASLSISVSISLSSIVSDLPRWALSLGTTNLIQEAIVVVLAVILDTTLSLVTPVASSTAHAIWAVTGHVSGVATDTADDIGCVVACLWAVVLAVTDLATVLAGLVLVVTEGAVESSKFTKLVTLELILRLGGRCGLRRISVIMTEDTEVERTVSMT